MPTKMTSTGITFPDNSTQSTAGGPVTTQYAIGSYVLGRPADYTTYNNSTVAGSSLYATSSYTVRVSENGGWAGNYSGAQNGISLINIGSWRCVSIAHAQGAEGAGGIAASGLWVRYA